MKRIVECGPLSPLNDHYNEIWWILHDNGADFRHEMIDLVIDDKKESVS